MIKLFNRCRCVNNATQQSESCYEFEFEWCFASWAHGPYGLSLGIGVGKDFE